MKPTLLILAAGIGSRYGSFKQIDKCGPSGETLMEYSVYDAIKAGFSKVVFIINRKIESEFNDWFAPRFNNKIDVDYVLQEVEIVTNGITYNPYRIKPWGTGHALLVSAPKITGPFAVINADDYYGAGIYQIMASHLRNPNNECYFLAGYKLKNTLSNYGQVSRAIGTKDNNGFLSSLKENTRIEKINNKIFNNEENGNLVELSGESIVSMNFFGFTPSAFKYFEISFKSFMENYSQNLKSEFFLPEVVNEIIKSGKEKVKILETESNWFGVTYKDDIETAKKQIRNYINANVYPENLWNP